MGRQLFARTQGPGVEEGWFLNNIKNKQDYNGDSGLAVLETGPAND